MAGRIVLRVVAALVLIAAVAGIAAFAYYAGAAHPAVQAAGAPAAGNGAALYFGWPFFPFFPFFGWGLFGLLIPLLLLAIAFGAVRRLIWGGPSLEHMHRMHRRYWGGQFDENGEGVPPMVAEWHRRLHDATNRDKAPEEKQE